MSERNEWKIDRAGWPAGPWDAEPEDRVEWRHKGVPCLAVRQEAGAWCGYAAVPPSHPWYPPAERDPEAEVSVHGGITFGDFCHEGGPICHVALPGEPEKVYWLGFDCLHSSDENPADSEFRKKWPRPWKEEYRTLAYVKSEVERLADQILAAGQDVILASRQLPDGRTAFVVPLTFDRARLYVGRGLEIDDEW